MKNAQLTTILAPVCALLTTLSVVIVPTLRAQEAPKAGVRRLTPEQADRVSDARFVNLGQAYKLFSEGKPADAIPIVKQVIAVEREVLKEAASNPVDDELPRPMDPFTRNILARSGVGDITDRLMQERAQRPTYRDFQWQRARSLELLEQLHETLGDFQSAKAVSAEVADTAVSLLGAANWAAVQARADVDRLGRLAALDRDHTQSIEAARKATALITSTQGPLGTAFCIDPQGLFLTLDEVAVPPSASVTTHFEYEGDGETLSGTREEPSLQTSPMGVVLNLGGPDVKRLPVRVFWRDKESRLALLKADSNEQLPALELAGPAKLVSGKEATALGLAFVNQIPYLAAGPTPTVRARPVRVTSVREKRGKPWFYQLDSSPPLGYSGGPVIDEQGRVIGVVVVGKPGTDIHYIVPVDAQSAPFARVVVDFEPPPLLFRDRHQARDWNFRLYSRTPMAKNTTVEIRIGPGAKARVYAGRQTKDRLYTATVVPVASGEPDLVELIVETEAGPVRATVADRELRVGLAAVRLSELRRIEPGHGPEVLTADGRRLAGPITGLTGLEGRFGTKFLTLDALRARRIALQFPAAYAGQVEAEVVVRNGADVLGRARTSLSYAHPPLETSRKINPTTVGFAPVPSPVEPLNVRLAAASVSRDPVSSGDRVHSLGGVHKYSPAVSPDGRLYANGGDDNTIQLFDAASGQMLRTIKLDAWVQSIDFSPDGRTLLAAAYQKQLHLLEVETGRDLGRFVEPHEPGLGESILSPDGRLAVSIHEGGKLLIWDVATGSVLRRPAERSRAFGFRLTPDSRKLLLAGTSAEGATCVSVMPERARLPGPCHYWTKSRRSSSAVTRSGRTGFMSRTRAAPSSGATWPMARRSAESPWRTQSAKAALPSRPMGGIYSWGIRIAA